MDLQAALDHCMDELLPINVRTEHMLSSCVTNLARVFCLQEELVASLSSLRAMGWVAPQANLRAALEQLQSKLTSQALKCESTVLSKLRVSPADLETALESFSNIKSVQEARMVLDSLGRPLVLPLQQFMPVFISVLSAQAEALSCIAGNITPAGSSALESQFAAAELQAMTGALGVVPSINVFYANCAVHSSENAQFRTQLQRILKARADQFSQWGCHKAAEEELSLLRQLLPQTAKRMLPSRYA
jgi:hypothetical protein